MGKAVAHALSFAPIDLGLALGLYQKHGLDLEVISFTGGAKLHQAMAAGAIDLGAGGGAEMGLIDKGAPELAVAAIVNSPALLAIIVAYDAPYRTLDDLRGKTIGVASVSGPTYFLARELARLKGWGEAGVTTVAIGGEPAGELAALKTGQVDAFIDGAAVGFRFEQQRAARVLAPASSYESAVLSSVIFASTRLIAENPTSVRRFLQGWFETIAFMRQHREEAIRLVLPITGNPPDIEAREFDLALPSFSPDGRFETAPLAALRHAMVALKIFDSEPDMAKFYTEKFLP